MMRAFICAIAFLVLSFGNVQADYDQSKDWFNSLSRNERIRLQFLLVFTGDYAAIVDGAFGPKTYGALMEFQRNREFRRDGVLDTEELQILHRDGLDLVKRVGFRTRNDPTAGITLGIPASLFDPPKKSERGHLWRAFDGSIELETLRVDGQRSDYEALYRRLTSTEDGRTIENKQFRNDFFVVSGTQNGRDFYLRMMRTGADSRGFSLFWQPKHAVFMDRVAIAMSNSLTFFDRSATGRMDAVTSAPALDNAPDSENRLGELSAGSTASTSDETGSSTGSGFFITPDGHVGTNAHVVGNCDNLEVAGFGSAALVASDTTNDLAIIQLDSKKADHFAQFRAKQPIVRGEEVFVLGYPFAQILDNNLNFTYGIVSALAGVSGDIRHFMVSAPVQPGNSGGPVLDRTGAVIGTVLSRLDKLKTLKVAGDLPENVNFAIRGRLMAEFMESLGLTPSYNTVTSIKTPTTIDQEAARYTVQVLCRN